MTSAPPPSASFGRFSTPWAIAAAALAVMGLAAAVYLDSRPGEPYIPPAPSRPETSSATANAQSRRIEALERRIDLLEQRYAELQQAASAAAPAASEAPEAAQTSVTAEAFSRLEQELTELKARMSEESPWKNEQLVALYRLEKAARAGKSFSAELDALLENPGLPEAVHRKLQPLAEQMEGLSTLPQLMRRFEESEETFVSGAALSDEAQGDTWAQIKYNFSSLVTIRKTGEESDNSDRARLARAQSLLKEGELTPAIEEVSQLSDDAAAYFEEWLSEARTRRRVLHAIEGARSLLGEDGASGSPTRGPGSV